MAAPATSVLLPGSPTEPDPVHHGSVRHRRRQVFPYALVLPAVAVLALMLGYPLVRLVVLSAQEYGLRQQFGAPPAWVGLDNYRTILTDDYFWDVLWRTLVFCFANVALTIGLGLLVALLLQMLGRGMRLAVTVALMLAWAMPPLSATIVWQWIFDAQHGLVNWLLTTLGIGDYQGHSWLSEPLSFFSVATIVVVWMGVPFVAFTLYAGLTQVPRELLEAASIDGAGAWDRFRAITLPILKPILTIVTALSVLWDFRVFTQIYVLQQAGGISRDTNLLGVYAYRVAIGETRFDLGAAIAVIMVLITFLLTVVYLRQMVRQEEL